MMSPRTWLILGKNVSQTWSQLMIPAWDDSKIIATTQPRQTCYTWSTTQLILFRHFFWWELEKKISKNIKKNLKKKSLKIQKSFKKTSKNCKKNFKKSKNFKFSEIFKNSQENSQNMSKTAAWSGSHRNGDFTLRMKSSTWAPRRRTRLGEILSPRWPLHFRAQAELLNSVTFLFHRVIFEFFFSIFNFFFSKFSRFFLSKFKFRSFVDVSSTCAVNCIGHEARILQIDSEFGIQIYDGSDKKDRMFYEDRRPSWECRLTRTSGTRKRTSSKKSTRLSVWWNQGYCTQSNSPDIRLMSHNLLILWVSNLWRHFELNIMTSLLAISFDVLVYKLISQKNYHRKFPETKI